MKLDREALWWKYSNAGVMISLRSFHALLDDIERQRGEFIGMASDALQAFIDLDNENALLAIDGYASELVLALDVARRITNDSATGQASPSVAPAPSSVGPARSAEPRETPMFHELEKKLRENVDYGGHDGYGPDPLHVGAANAIRDLRDTLRSQIEICNTERSAKELNEHELSQAREQIAFSREVIEQKQSALDRMTMELERSEQQLAKYEKALRHLAENAFAHKDWQFARDALNGFDPDIAAQRKD